MKRKIARLDPKKTALLVIDMQNAFAEKGGKLEIKGIRNGVPRFKTFIDDCRERGILVIYTRHYYTKTGNPIAHLLFSDLSSRGLTKKDTRFEILKELKPEKGDLVIDKNRYDAFFKTDLHEILKSRRIKNLIITGTMTQVCCESTARSAMFHDYITLFCSDLNFSGDRAIQKGTLRTLDKYFGWTLDSNGIRRLIH